MVELDISDDNLAALMEEQRRTLLTDDAISMIGNVDQLQWRWAAFELFIINPSIPVISPPLIIPPARLKDSDVLEHVYRIEDRGYSLATSKASEMYSAGTSMCKLYYTIEKMIFLLVERLKTGGVSPETEVQVAFGGYELAQRKAFEVIINLNYNVVVTNFDPSVWGERYLQTVKRMVDRGYGYPSEAPRDAFRQLHTSRTMSRS